VFAPRIIQRAVKNEEVGAESIACTLDNVQAGSTLVALYSSTTANRYVTVNDVTLGASKDSVGNAWTKVAETWTPTNYLPTSLYIATNVRGGTTTVRLLNATSLTCIGQVVLLEVSASSVFAVKTWHDIELYTMTHYASDVAVSARNALFVSAGIVDVDRGAMLPLDGWQHIPVSGTYANQHFFQTYQSDGPSPPMRGAWYQLIGCYGAGCMLVLQNLEQSPSSGGSPILQRRASSEKPASAPVINSSHPFGKYIKAYWACTERSGSLSARNLERDMNMSATTATWAPDGIDIGSAAKGLWIGTPKSSLLYPAVGGTDASHGYGLIMGVRCYGSGFYNQPDNPFYFRNMQFGIGSGYALFEYHGNPWRSTTGIGGLVAGRTYHMAAYVGANLRFCVNGQVVHDAAAPSPYNPLADTMGFRGGADVSQRTDIVLLYAGVIWGQPSIPEMADFTRNPYDVFRATRGKSMIVVPSTYAPSEPCAFRGAPALRMGRKTWTRRPSGILEIDRSSPQARGLEWMAVASDGKLMDPLGSRVFTPVGASASIVQYPEGGYAAESIAVGGGYFSSSRLAIELPCTIAMWYTSIGVLTNKRLFQTCTSSISADYYTGFMLWDQAIAGGWSASFGSGFSASVGRRTGTTSIIPPVGVPTHMVAVMRGSTDMTLYHNGTSVGVTYSGSGGAVLTDSGPLTIGAGTNTVLESCSARIPDIRIYNEALSPAEVRSLYDPSTRWSLGIPSVNRVYTTVPSAYPGMKLRGW